MQEIGIHRVGRLLLALAVIDRNIALFAIGHERLTRREVPFPPGGDDLDTRFQRIGAEFETHLVVTLTGSAMGNGIRARLIGNLDQPFGDQRAGNGSAEQVLTFVNRIGTEHREHEVAHKLLAQVIDVDFLHAQRLSFGARWRHLFTLTDVGRESDHLTSVMIL